MTQKSKKTVVGILAITIFSSSIMTPLSVYGDGMEEVKIERGAEDKQEELESKAVYVLDIPDVKFRALIWRGLDRYYDPYEKNELAVGSPRRYSSYNIYAEDMLKLAQVKELNIGLNNVDSIEGIQFFTELESLIADGNRNLKIADLSKCFSLKQLRLHECGLEEVILPSNLEKLRLDSNKLKHIDLSKTRKLEWLVAFNNELEELDLSGLDRLEVANLDKNNIKNIKLSNNIKLRELLLKDNEISKIDLSDAVGLETLSLKNNKLSKLDLSNNSKLKLNTLDNLLDNQNVEIDVHKDVKSYFVKKDEIDIGVYENLLNRESSSLDGDKLRFKDITSLDYKHDTNASTKSYREMNVKIIPNISYIDVDEDDRLEDKVLVNVKYSIYGTTVKEEKMWMDIGRRINQDLFLAMPEYNTSYMTLGREHGLGLINKDTKEIEVKMRERLRVDQADLKDLIILMDEDMKRESFKKYPQSRIDEFLLNLEDAREIASKENFDSFSDRMVESQTAYLNIMNSYFALENEVKIEELKVLDIKDEILRKAIWKKMNRKVDPYLDLELSKDSMKKYKNYNIYNRDIARLDIIGEIDLTGTEVEKLDGIENLYNIAKIVVNDTSKLKKVDLSKLEVLTHFYADNGVLEEVKFGKIGLEHLKIRNNNLRELDFRGLDELLDVRAEGNKLEKVDMSQNDNLKFVFLDDNNLRDIDFKNNKSINGMGISNNKLAYLDLSNNKIVGHNMILPNGGLGNQIIEANLEKVNNKYRLRLEDIMPKKHIKNIINVENGILTKDNRFLEFNSLENIGYEIKTGIEHDVYGIMDVKILGSLDKGKDNVLVIPSGPSQSSEPSTVSPVEKSPSEVVKETIDKSIDKPVENVPGFRDLDGKFKWAKKEVDLLKEKRIINGRRDNEFMPEGSVTRAEFVTMLVRLIESDGLEINRNISIEFKDINKNDWYSEYIEKALNEGIVSGINKEFNPNKEITREEALKMIGNILKNESIGVEKGLIDGLDDASNISIWAREEINLGLSLGIVEGFNNRFNPKSKLNRAEAAVIVYRLMNLQ